jgi:endogenous inhibitor of DNA gyrase (YacG/DUF329 family)
MGARVRHTCPICGRDAPPRRGDPPNPSFPFCSPPCKLVDLGHWLDGTYRIPEPNGSSADGETAPAPKGEGDE